MFERLADEDFAYLTTIGRRSGKQHTIEIWFALHDAAFTWCRAAATAPIG